MSFKPLTVGTTALGIALVLWVESTTPSTSTQVETSILLTLFALYAFTEFFPLVRNQTSISLSLSVDLLIFLKFGLLPLVLISQLSALIGRWKRVGKIEPLIVIANGGMFLVTTGGAAGIFLLCGGSHDANLSNNLIPLLAYIVGHFVLNHICLYLFVHTLNGTTLRSHLQNMSFDAVSSSVASTLGLILILLYEANGLIGLLGFGVPLVLCIYVLKLFNDVSVANNLFRNLARLTRDFSGELEMELMCSRVTEELPSWFENAQCVIYLSQSGTLSPISSSNGLKLNTEGIAAFQMIVEQQQAEMKNLSPFMIKRLHEEPMLGSTAYKRSLVAPIVSDQNVMGYCCLLSEKFGDFDATSLDALSILANQLAVSFRTVMRYEDVEKQSLYDELTQLPNQRFCERRLSEEILRAKATGVSLSLLVIDLDHFKSVNDRFGHQAGNDVLHTIARTFESSLRKSDFVARYGGEEFLVVLPGADSDLAMQIAEKIRRNVEQQIIAVKTMDGESLDINLTVSIGVATCPQHGKDQHQLIRFADRAMYIGAKRAGRNRVAVYEREKVNT